MGVSKSGFYKWKSRDITARSVTRAYVVGLVEAIHAEHPSHGYRWVNAYIRLNYGEEYSDNYIYKAFRYLGIQAKTSHRAKSRKKTCTTAYPNLIFSTWETVDRPRQVIVSDMTAFTVYRVYYELTMYFDVFTKEILSWELTNKRGNRDQYIDGLKTVIALLGDLNLPDPTIIHTDQGTVYSSVAFNDLLKNKNIERSMSRAGKPTDNPVNESLNGWIKEELFVDFRLDQSNDVYETIQNYVWYFNNQRPCYSIGYDTPANYYVRYTNGELDIKDTFSKRELSPEPKFVKKRKAAAAKKSTSG